jgi:hypothetical protein
MVPTDDTIETIKQSAFALYVRKKTIMPTQYA